MIDPAVRSGTALDPETRDTLLRFIRPRPEELTWQAIPWQPSLPAGLALAQREQKPILLWAMNGHPLALT